MDVTLEDIGPLAGREPTPGPAPSTGGDKCFRLT